MKSSGEQKEQEIALYRKYRPQKFKDVVGQDHVVSVLDTSIKNNSISHAYLFAGSRGTGKTSVARIFAREIGCSNNDLYEIDAASNTGVENIRDLNESVRTLPFESPYKVYILDEAHMLSKSAFNALLKTLEEPPKHVVFILATTETDKLPETVISRCQTFQFKKPTEAILKDVVLSIAKAEGASLDNAGAELIALLGDGSFRDTQGMLQKVLSFSKDKKITLDEVEKITGAPKSAVINDFVEAVSSSDVATSIGVLHKASEGNSDIKVFLKLSLQKMRFVLLLKFAKDMEKVIHDKVSEEDFEFLLNLSKKDKQGINSMTLFELLGAYDQCGRSHIPELPIELAIIKSFGDNG